MGIPARVLCRVAGGKASGGLSRKGTKRAFQEPSQALLRYRGPIPPGPSEDAWGQPAAGGWTPLRSRDVQGMEQASPDRGQGLWSRLAMMLARAWASTISFALCTKLNSPSEKMYVRSKKH